MISFNPIEKLLESFPGAEVLDHAALQDYLQQTGDLIAVLDETEPEDMESEEYELWADQHEALEDIRDEILDYL